MYNATDAAYLQSTAIKKGEYQLHPKDQELVDWITGITGIKALNFCFETVETLMGYRVQHIRVIAERIAECRKMDGTPEYGKIIARFQQYFDEYGTTNKDNLKNEVFPRAGGIYPETILSFRPLEEIELKIANEKAMDEIVAIADHYPQVWVISINMNWQNIFYYTDEQLMANRSNGVNEEIKSKILDILKQYDEYDYFGEHSLQVQFDSKEAFDRDYDGNWCYYYK